MAKAPFFFAEQKNTTFYHNMIVYINGANVTPWITSSINIRKSDRNGINSCSFTLSNAYRAFEITEDNLNGKFRLLDPYTPSGHYSELAKYQIYKWKTQKENNRIHEVNTFGPVKSSGAGGRVLNDKNSTRNASQAQSDATTRFPLTIGSLVFHKYDPIRIFVQNPLRRQDDQWFMEFTGYVDVKPYSQNYLNGESIITVTCQDIRMQMQGMRVQTNPAAQIGNENTLFFTGDPGAKIPDASSAGYFNDLITKNYAISHVLGGQTWTDSVKFLLFGTYRGIITNIGSTSSVNATQKSSMYGIGNLTEGTTIEYDPAEDVEASRDKMERWNNIVQFGESEKFLTLQQVHEIGAGTVPGGTYSPDNSKVHFLLPAKEAPLNNLIQYFFDGQVDARVEFESRLELLTKLCKSVDYQMYVSGTGDIIFEFPLYDFLPTEFNPIYSNILTVDDHTIQDSIDDESSSPVTALIVESTYNRGEIAQENSEAVVNGVATANQLTRTIFSNVLASRFGVYPETYSIPGITDQDRLTQLGMIEFNKRLANFNKFSVTSSYRPFLGVNRPIYYKVKERLGITESVTNTYNIRADVSTSIDLNYTRKKEADGRFRFITGGERQPISYRTMYDKVFVPKQGVNVDGAGEGKGGVKQPTAVATPDKKL